MHDVRQVMPADGIVALDNGMYKIWFARNYRTRVANTLLFDNALATMGAGLPSAMMAAMLYPKRRVLAVCGDGGFMMNSQELETAVRLRLDLVVLVLVDNAYGMIRWKQAVDGFADFGMTFGNPDFVRYAQAYGAQGRHLTEIGELAAALEAAFQAGGVHLLAVPIDYSENSRVLVRRAARPPARTVGRCAARLFGLDAGLLDDRGPARRIALHQRRQLFGRAVRDLHSLGRERALHLGLRESGAQVAFDPRDDVAAKALRTHHRVPEIGVDAVVAELAQARYVGRQRRASIAGGGKDDQTAALDLRHRHVDRQEHQRHVAGEDRAHGARRAGERDVGERDLGPQLEKLHRHEVRRRDAG